MLSVKSGSVMIVSIDLVNWLVIVGMGKLLLFMSMKVY